MESVKCIVLEHRQITGYRNAKDMIDLDTEELFVVDLDGLAKGAYNLKLYTEIAKFFEITVMSFPRRVADLVDTIISGASRVVVSSNLTERNLKDFLGITEDLVMNYGRMETCRLFSANDGVYYLSNRMVDLPYRKVYHYGQPVDKEGYIQIQNFPDFITAAPSDL